MAHCPGMKLPHGLAVVALVIGGGALVGCAPAATDLRPVPSHSSAAAPPAYYPRPYAATPPVANYPGVPRAFWPSVANGEYAVEDETSRRAVAKGPSARRKAAPQTEQDADVVAADLPPSPPPRRLTQPAGVAPGKECGWHRLCNLPGWRYEN